MSTAIIWFNPVNGAFKAKRNVSGTWVWKELAFVDDLSAAQHDIRRENSKWKN